MLVRQQREQQGPKLEHRRRREGGGGRIGSNIRSSGRLRQRIKRIQGFVGDVDDGGHRGSRRSRCIEGLGLGCRPQVVSSHRGRRGALARRVNAAPPLSPRG
jgi:hypothetical protein